MFVIVIFAPELNYKELTLYSKFSLNRNTLNKVINYSADKCDRLAGI